MAGGCVQQMKDKKGIQMKTILKFAILVCGLAVLPVQAQLAVPPPATIYQPLSAQQLDQLLGPIALYPDPLMAEILPAATLPTQIVMADRYVSGGGDPGQIAQQPWDASVQAVAHYPNVLKYLDDNLNWTEELGQAFLNQQQDVMDSVQRLRSEAQNLGNLQSTPQEQVDTDDGDIDIVPTDPDVIYVPVYQPDQVYYDSGFGISFGTGFPIGFWLSSDFDWHHHNVIVWDRDHPRPDGWWHQPPTTRYAVLASRAPAVWHPVNRPGFATGNRGDRGWNNTVARPEASRAEENRPEARPVERPAAPTPEASRPEASRPEAAPAVRPGAASRPTSDGAFIGAESSHDTKAFSERGQQSIEASHPQATPRSEPAPRPAPAPASHSSSGGGSQTRHF